MGYVALPLAPWHLTLERQAAALLPLLAWRYRDADGRLLWRGRLLWWRRRRAHEACLALQRLHHHALYGEGAVLHAGACPLGTGTCTGAAAALPGRTNSPQSLVARPRDPGKPRTL